jgi:hypothetical protein
MALEYSSVDCAEEFDSYKEDFSVDGGPSASVVLRCKYSDRYALADDLLSNAATPPQMAGFAKPPQARRCGIRPFTGDEVANPFSVDGQVILYAEALVTVEYSTQVMDLVSESIEPTAEFLIQDYRRLRWGSAVGEPILEAEAPGRLYQSCNIVRTLYYVANVPPEVLSLVGKVNDAPWVSGLLGLTFDTETLLYQPPNVGRKIATNGSDGYTMATKFTYKPQGWNTYWRAKTQSFEQQYIVGGAVYKQYIPDDMSALLP